MRCPARASELQAGLSDAPRRDITIRLRPIFSGIAGVGAKLVSGVRLAGFDERDKLLVRA